MKTCSKFAPNPGRSRQYSNCTTIPIFSLSRQEAMSDSAYRCLNSFQQFRFQQKLSCQFLGTFYTELQSLYRLGPFHRLNKRESRTKNN